MSYKCLLCFLYTLFFVLLHAEAYSNSPEEEIRKLKNKEAELLNTSPDSLLKWIEQNKKKKPSFPVSFHYEMLKAKCLNTLGDYSESKKTMDSLLNKNNKLPALYRARALTQKGATLLLSENLSESIDCFLKALTFYQGYNDKDEQAYFYTQILWYYITADDKNKINVYLEKINELLNSGINDPTTRVISHLRLGENFFNWVKIDSGVYHLNQSITIALKYNLKDLAADGYNMLGYFLSHYSAVGIDRYFHQADSLYQLTGNKRNRAHTLNNYVRYLLAKNKLSKARIVLDTIGSLLETNWFYQQQYYYELKTEYYRKVNNINQAIATIKIANSWQIRRVETILNEKAQIAEAKLDNEKKQRLIDFQSHFIAEKEREVKKVQERRKWLLGLIFLFTIFFSGMFYYSIKLRNANRKLAMQSTELELLNQSLADDKENINQKNATLEQTMAHNQVLMKEMNHRVKNNLAMLAGLLELQKVQAENPAIKKELSDVISRLQVVSSFHKSLYQQDESSSSMSVRGILLQLCEKQRKMLASGFSSAIHIDVENHEMSISKLLPLCLILNELMTNACKYALDAEGDEIRVFFKENGTKYLLEVRDTGPGIPEENVFDVKKHMGLNLVTLLTKQLKGQFSWSREGKWFSMRIEFPIQQDVADVNI